MGSSFEKAEDPFSSLKGPSEEDLRIHLEDLVAQGTISPEQAQAALVERSQMQDIQQDPQARSAQQAALSQLQDITESGGLTAMDRSKLNQISMDEDTKARGGREAILQNMAQRGMGGSGMELLAQLQNQQDSVTRKNSRDLDVAAMAQQNALNALMNQGNLATQVGNQQFEQQAAKANAADAISKFNAQNRQQVGLANTAANNNAQQTNLQNKQNIYNQNVGTHNQQEMYNKNLPQQMFNNQLSLAKGSSDVNQSNAKLKAEQDARNDAFIKQMLGSGITAGAMSDERQKEEISDFDPSAFLDSITSHKYQYKDKKYGSGDHYGPMAQDLEKTDMGASLVNDTPEGKIVDTNKATMAALGSLGNLNERLNRLEKDEDEDV